MRPRWIEFLRGSVVDRLIAHSGHIDVYVISAEAESRPSAAPRRGDRIAPGSATRGASPSSERDPARRAGSARHLAGQPGDALPGCGRRRALPGPRAGGPGIGPGRPGVRFFPGRAAAHLDRGRHRVHAHLRRAVRGRPGHQLSGGPVTRAGRGGAAPRGPGRALYAFSRDLAAAGGLDDILQVVIRHVRETFGREAAVLLPTVIRYSPLKRIRPRVQHRPRAGRERAGGRRVGLRAASRPARDRHLPAADCATCR